MFRYLIVSALILSIYVFIQTLKAIGHMTDIDD